MRPDIQSPPHRIRNRVISLPRFGGVVHMTVVRCILRGAPTSVGAYHEIARSVRAAALDVRKVSLVMGGQGVQNRGARLGC